MKKHSPDWSFYAKYNVRRKSQRTVKWDGMTLSDLLKDDDHFLPRIVLLKGNDGSMNHAVTVVDDLIFDSTQKFALKKCKESFDWCCGDEGCGGVGPVMQFNCRKKGKLREKMKNW